MTTDHVTEATTVVELSRILRALGSSSITVDLAGRRVLVTLTCPIATSAASGETVSEAIDRAIDRLKESRVLQERVRTGAILAGLPLVHPTAVRCSACGAFAAHELTHQRELEKMAVREGHLGFVDPEFVVRVDPGPGAYRVMLCNTLVAGPTRVVDGREYHEVRVIAAESASVAMAAVDCNEFLCLPERHPSHYVDQRHRPIRGRE